MKCTCENIMSTALIISRTMYLPSLFFIILTWEIFALPVTPTGWKDFFFASLNESVLVISISQEIHISFMIISQCNKNTALPNYRVLCDVLSSEFRFPNVFTALINGLLFCLDLSGAEGLYINNIKSITTNFVYLNDFFSQVTEIYSIKTKTIKIQ